jgi:dihydropteroate synthase
MGVINVTPDSFSDGGRHRSVAAALEHALTMVAEGAALIDVGGESTRPGARPVPLEEERQRVLPVVEALATHVPVPISVDTSKPEIMREAVARGAGMINDVRALRVPGALPAAAGAGVPVVLMHMLGEPQSMQREPSYRDVVTEVYDFLAQRVEVCTKAGIPNGRLLVDPGFGFGKTLAHNLALLRHLDVFAGLGLPVLVGLSRKSMIGSLIDRPVDQRVNGSTAAAVIAAWQGARIVRTHDVGPTVEAMAVCDAVHGAGPPGADT